MTETRQKTKWFFRGERFVTHKKDPISDFLILKNGLHSDFLIVKRFISDFLIMKRVYRRVGMSDFLLTIFIVEKLNLLHLQKRFENNNSQNEASLLLFGLHLLRWSTY